MKVAHFLRHSVYAQRLSMEYSECAIIKIPCTNSTNFYLHTLHNAH